MPLSARVAKNEHPSSLSIQKQELPTRSSQQGQNSTLPDPIGDKFNTHNTLKLEPMGSLATLSNRSGKAGAKPHGPKLGPIQLKPITARNFLSDEISGALNISGAGGTQYATKDAIRPGAAGPTTVTTVGSNSPAADVLGGSVSLQVDPSTSYRNGTHPPFPKRELFKRYENLTSAYGVPTTGAGSGMGSYHGGGVGGEKGSVSIPPVRAGGSGNQPAHKKRLRGGARGEQHRLPPDTVVEISIPRSTLKLQSLADTGSESDTGAEVGVLHQLQQQEEKQGEQDPLLASASPRWVGLTATVEVDVKGSGVRFSQPSRPPLPAIEVAPEAPKESQTPQTVNNGGSIETDETVAELTSLACSGNADTTDRAAGATAAVCSSSDARAEQPVPKLLPDLASDAHSSSSSGQQQPESSLSHRSQNSTKHIHSSICDAPTQESKLNDAAIVILGSSAGEQQQSSGASLTEAQAEDATAATGAPSGLAPSGLAPSGRAGGNPRGGAPTFTVQQLVLTPAKPSAEKPSSSSRGRPSHPARAHAVAGSEVIIVPSVVAAATMQGGSIESLPTQQHEQSQYKYQQQGQGLSSFQPLGVHTHHNSIPAPMHYHYTTSSASSAGHATTASKNSLATGKAVASAAAAGGGSARGTVSDESAAVSAAHGANRRGKAPRVIGGRNQSQQHDQQRQQQAQFLGSSKPTPDALGGAAVLLPHDFLARADAALGVQQAKQQVAGRGGGGGGHQLNMHHILRETERALHGPVPVEDGTSSAGDNTRANNAMYVTEEYKSSSTAAPGGIVYDDELPLCGDSVGAAGGAGRSLAAETAAAIVEVKGSKQNEATLGASSNSDKSMNRTLLGIENAQQTQDIPGKRIVEPGQEQRQKQVKVLTLSDYIMDPNISSAATTVSAATVEDSAKKKRKHASEVGEKDVGSAALSPLEAAILAAKQAGTDPMATGALSPETALSRHAALLSAYEQEEIKSAPAVYYVGANCEQRLRGNVATALHGSEYNNGFDTADGDYMTAPGDHLAFRFEVLGALGKGSFGNVHKCRDHRTGADVAVKVVKSHQRFAKQAEKELQILEMIKDYTASDAFADSISLSAFSVTSTASTNRKGSRNRGFSSSTATAGLDTNPTTHGSSSTAAGRNEQAHFLVQLVESFTFRAHRCFVFPLFGLNLYDYLKQRDFQGLSMGFVRKVAVQLLQALSHLRQLQVIHCDIKPENILLTDEASASIVLIDFGSSCLNTETVFTYIQSRFYRSPEVLLGCKYGKYQMLISCICLLCVILSLISSCAHT